VAGKRIHIDILVWAGCGIIKASQAACFVKHDRYPINIKDSTRDVGACTECAYLQGVQGLILVEFYLQEIVIEISLRSHGDQHDGSASFSPWDQIGVVLVDGKEDHWLLRIHSVVVLDVL